MGLIVLIAYFVKGMCGFANTLIISTLMSFRADNIAISPIDLVLGGPANILIAWRERASVRLRVWLPLAAMVVLGTLPGIFFLKVGDAGLIKALLGLVVMGLGVEMLLRMYRPAKCRPSRPVLACIGVVSGLLGGLYGIGALLAAYVSRTTDNDSAFKGNMCMVFMVDNLFRTVVYACTGILTLGIVRQALMLVPFIWAGWGWAFGAASA